MSDERRQPSAVRGVLAMAAFVVVVAGMKAAQAIIVPFLLAVFITIIVSPAYLWLRRWHVPAVAALLVMITVLVAAGLGVVTLVGSSLDGFLEDLPTYQARLQEQTDGFLVWLEGKGMEAPDRVVAESLNPQAAMGFVGNLLSSLSGLISQSFLIILCVAFMLFELSALRDKMRAIPGEDGRTTTRYEEIADNVRRYMGIKTLISLLTGVIVTAWLAILGVKYAALWGLVAFLFNYVPNIGSIIAAVPPVVLALVDDGIATAVWVAAGFLAVNMLIGNVVEPRLMGRGLGLSTLIVFISLVFWGWVLGPVGMLLSAPLTMAAKIVVGGSADMRWLAVLMGSQVPPGTGPPAG